MREFSKRSMAFSNVQCSMANREKVYIVVCGDTGEDKVQRYHLATRRTFTDRDEAQSFAATCSPSRKALVVEGDFYGLRRFRFANTECSQCGMAFGPGDGGFSHCIDHQGLLDEEN